jgi:hypothetical protein
VYCEGPSATGCVRRKRWRRWPSDRGVVAVAGTQARVAPEVQFARGLIADGFVGEELSSMLTAWSGGWGATIRA